MHYSSINSLIKELIFKPAGQYEALSNYMNILLKKSKTELEFLSRVREIIGNLCQDRSHEIQLLNKVITISENDYRLFYKITADIKENLLAFKLPKVSGILKSGKNNEFTFIYEYYYDYLIYLNAHGYVFNIWEKGREDKSTFSFQLREMENGIDLKVTDLYADSERFYLGKGISIAMIFEAKKIFNKRIISSSNKSRGNYTEFNTEEAIEKVWSRLVNDGLAEYDPKLDYYFVL